MIGRLAAHLRPLSLGERARERIGRPARRGLPALLVTAGAILAGCGTKPPAAAPASSVAASGKPSTSSAPGSISARPAASAAASANAAAQTTHVRLAYGTANLLNVPIWIAQEKGIFKKYGIDAE